LLTKKFGPRAMTVGGMLGMGVGMTMMALATVGGGLLFVEAALLVIGIGLGLNTAPVQNVAVAAVAAARAGTASGLVNTARMVGATLGVAVLGLSFGTQGDAGGAGFAPAYLVGSAGELLGAVLAFAFVGGDALRKRA
jgi:hypothetical protein